MANPIVPETIAEITETIGVIQSATVLINTFDTLLANAVTAALANGATEAELVPFAELKTALDTNTNALAAAVAANAPPAPGPATAKKP